MRRLLWVAAAVLIFAGVLIAQRPTFRAGVDLVAVDVRVIDKDGHPIVDLKPGDFQVEIGGHKRSVVSADFVRIGTSTLSQDTGPRAGAAPETAGVAPPPDDGRFVIVAIDAMSFDSTASRGVAAAIARFVGGFTPQDRVGLYTFPLGPKVEPTVDRAEVERELGHLIGQADDTQAITIAPSELVDISAGDPLATSRAVARNCGAAGNPAPMRGRGESGGRLGACNPETCAGRVLCEVGNRLLQDEAGAVASL